MASALFAIVVPILKKHAKARCQERVQPNPSDQQLQAFGSPAFEALVLRAYFGPQPRKGCCPGISRAAEKSQGKSRVEARFPIPLQPLLVLCGAALCPRLGRHPEQAPLHSGEA